MYIIMMKIITSIWMDDTAQSHSNYLIEINKLV